MANKLYQDRSGNISSKRLLMLSAGLVLIILTLLSGLGWIYYSFIKGISKDLTSILALLGVLSGFIVTVTGITLGEKKD